MKKAKHTEGPAMTVEQRKKAKARKSAIGWTVFLGLLAAVVAALALLPRMMEKAAEEPAEIRSVQAAPGTIVSAIHTAGTLADEDAESITLPKGVELEYAVKAGDYVEAGDLIATVDETSVMLTIAELQSAMDELDEELAEAMDGENSPTVTAAADGRVKAVYARGGEAVAETMYDHGALMLLSLDGKMAVDIESGGVSAGQSVTVALDDGSEKSGRVASVTGKVATVTISDKGTDLGAVAAVYDGDGVYLGGGELYIHSELAVTGYYGVTDEIFVEEEALVEQGDKLMSFAQTDDAAAYAALLVQRRQMEEQIRSLFQVYERGGVYAESAGYVTELGGNEDTTAGGNDFGGFMPMASVTETITAVEELLNAAGAPEDMPESGEPEPTPEPEITSTPMPTEEPEITPTPIPTEEPEPEVTPTPVPTEEPEGGDSSGEPEVTPTPVPTETPEGGAGSGEPSGEPEETVSGLRDVYALVDSAGDGMLTIRTCQTEEYIHYGDAAALAALDYTEEASLFYTDPTADPTAAQTTVFFYVNGQWSLGTMSGITAGANLVLTYGDGGSGEKLMWIVCHQATAPGGTSGSTGSTTASGEMTGTTLPTGGVTMPDGIMGQQQQQKTGVLAEITVCAITPDTDMTVSIAVDEMDILRVAEGQTVSLYLPALDETVSGRITELAEAGTTGSGNAKFSAVITVSRTAEMRRGMNAAVTIVLAEKEAGCCLPAEALAEMDGTTAVYTIYDGKNETLTGLVEVTTGVSDGDMVEITSGVPAGTTVYYAYTETGSQVFF